MADIPQAQKQERVEINLTTDGNVLLYGSPGTGKTTFLQSTAMDLARRYSPEQVILYLLDFGTNGLAPLRGLPHTADLMLLDQTEKVSKFVRIMEKELNRRKKLLSDQGVGSLNLYEEATGERETRIIILLDSFEAMKDEPFEAALFKILLRISREGLSIGVHLIMTAGRQNNLRATLYSNFKHQLTLKQNDVGEIRTIVGSTPLASTMEDIKGRALMKRDEAQVVQFVLPASGAHDVAVMQGLREQVAHLQAAWSGQRPSAIPMVPEELTEKYFYKQASVEEAIRERNIPAGLSDEEVISVNLRLSSLKNILILSDNKLSIRYSVQHLVNVIETCVENSHVLIVDSSDEYGLVQEQVESYLAGDDVVQLFGQLETEIESRKQTPKAVETFIFIPDLLSFIEKVTISEDDFYQLYMEAYKYGIHFVIAGLKSTFFKTHDVVKVVKDNITTAWIAMRLYDQAMVAHSSTSQEEKLAADQAYLYDKGKTEKIKIIKQEIEE